MPAEGRYVVITGKYRIRNNGNGQQPRPDGDTIKFIVDKPDLVRRLPRFGGVKPKISKKTNSISLRLEAIDALETHYPTDNGHGPEVHQSKGLALEARDVLVEQLGFSGVVFNEDSTVKSADKFSVDGYVLANGVENNGRVVAFAFAGNRPPGPNGKRIRLDSQLMDSSANIKLLNQGLAYATLYQTLPLELIVHARDLARVARQKKLGVFGAEDVGVLKSSRINGLSDLQEMVMLPKLFRRLADFFVVAEDTLSGFDSWVQEDEKRDDVLILPSGEVGNLHDLYEVADDSLKLRSNPEEVQVLQ
jgi:hypothetical protein